MILSSQYFKLLKLQYWSLKLEHFLNSNQRKGKEMRERSDMSAHTGPIEEGEIREVRLVRTFSYEHDCTDNS